MLRAQDWDHVTEFSEYVRQQRVDKKYNILAYEYGYKHDDEYGLSCSTDENKNDQL